MDCMVQKGQWLVLPYKEVQDLPGLRVSPLGIMPQHDRQPRTIVDYTYSGVNTETQSLAPKEAMQFGKALTRILTKIVRVDACHGPVKLIKVDVADGFYQIHLAPQHIPSLGVAFPPTPSGTQLVAFPLVLPMGWVESPPLFCVATETIADLANASLQQGISVPPHRLRALADTPAPPFEIPRPPELTTFESTALPNHPVGPCRRPLKYVDVYVDNFIGLAQGNSNTCNQVRDHLFMAIDKVFRPASPSEEKQRQEPASIKKLSKGDGCWSTQKQVLGWDIDTLAQTINLPPWRLKRLVDILADYPPRANAGYPLISGTKPWGTPQHVLGYPGTSGPLQSAAKGPAAVYQQADGSSYQAISRGA